MLPEIFAFRFCCFLHVKDFVLTLDNNSPIFQRPNFNVFLQTLQVHSAVRFRCFFRSFFELGAKLQTLYLIRKYFSEKVTLKKLNDIFCCFITVKKIGFFGDI